MSSYITLRQLYATLRPFTLLYATLLYLVTSPQNPTHTKCQLLQRFPLPHCFLNSLGKWIINWIMEIRSFSITCHSFFAGKLESEAFLHYFYFAVVLDCFEFPTITSMRMFEFGITIYRNFVISRTVETPQTTSTTHILPETY